MSLILIHFQDCVLNVAFDYRQYPNNILMMFNEFGKKPPQFGDALTVADEILNSGLDFEKGILVYNRFR